MHMMIFYYLMVIATGLLIGSFLNVCIYRIPREESVIKPPSHCMNCGNRLTAIDLVPVLSYLLLRGKCRHCKVKISPRYALVEGLTALTFVLLFAKFGLTMDFFASSYLMSILIAVFFIDLDHMIIPDGLVIAGLAGGVPLIIYNAFRPGETNVMQIYGDGNWWTPLIGILVGFGMLFLVATIGFLIYRTDEAMGGGDIKIFAPIGIFLGWKMTFVAFFLSVVLAGFIGGILILAKIKDRKGTIPFGPFIVIGTFMTYMFGWDLLSWYINSVLSR